MNFTKEISKLKKGQFSSVYLVLGTESYLADTAREVFIQSVLKEEERELNFGAYDMDEVSVGVALDDAESIPFFGERRLVIIDHPFFLTGDKTKRKIEHDLKWFEQYLEYPSETTVLVIFALYEKLDERKKISKLLKKKATVIEAETLNEKEARIYIKETIANDDFSISPEALEQFLQLVDANLSTAMGELPKLFLYSQNSRQITKQAVNELVAKSLEQNIFALNEYVLKKNVGAALSLYKDLLLQKEEPIKINSIMTSQFRLLIQVKLLERTGHSQGDIAKMLKVHPYRIKLALQQIRKLSEDHLVEAYNGLIEMEYRLKTGQGNRDMQFELFVLSYAR